MSNKLTPNLAPPAALLILPLIPFLRFVVKLAAHWLNSPICVSNVCSFVPVHSCGRSNHDSGLRNSVNTSLSLTGWTLVWLARPTERPSLSLDISECFDLQRFHFVQFTDYLFTHSVFIPRLYLNSSFFHVFVFCDTKFGFYLSTKVLWVFPLGYRFGGETSRLFVFSSPLL